MRRSLAVTSVALLLLSSSASAWWEDGHRIVARLAAAHLTPAARTRIAHILEVADTPDAVADALAVASTWADETKGQTGTGSWHFIDLTLTDTPADFSRRCPDDNCAPARIHIFASELRSHQRDQRWSELDELRYLIHLMGDIHQPLHAASDADEGGNCELLSAPIDKAKNLHALWDGAIIAEMGGDARSLAESLEKDIVALHGSERERLAAGTINEWTWQSHEVAVRDIYQKLHVPLEPAIFPSSCGNAPADIRNFHPVIDGLYIDSMKPVVRAQLTRAGLRLARLLNESM
jgi:hypothetical protein